MGGSLRVEQKKGSSVNKEEIRTKGFQGPYKDLISRCEWSVFIMGISMKESEACLQARHLIWFEYRKDHSGWYVGYILCRALAFKMCCLQPAAVSPGNFLEMCILRSHPDLQNQKLWVELSNLYFNKPSK